MTVPEQELTFTACKWGRSIFSVLQMDIRSTKILRLTLLWFYTSELDTDFFPPECPVQHSISHVHSTAPRDSVRSKRALTLDTINGIQETTEKNSLPAVKRMIWNSSFVQQEYHMARMKKNLFHRETFKAMTQETIGSCRKINFLVHYAKSLFKILFKGINSVTLFFFLFFPFPSHICSLSLHLAIAYLLDVVSMCGCHGF